MEHGPKLTPRQQAFVEAYIVTLNATKAATEAGYSAKTAKSQGQRLLTNDDVADAIATAMKDRAKANKLDADRVLNELVELAFFDIGKAFNPDGTMKPLDQIDEGTRRAIVGLDVVALNSDGEQVGTIKKVRFADKKSALDTLAKHLGLLTDRLKISGDQSDPIAMLIQHCQGTTIKIHRDGDPVDPRLVNYDHNQN